MPRPRPNPNPHRIWLRVAIHSGLFERLPPRYSPAGSGPSQDTIDYARDLYAELRDPDISPRPVDEIIADAIRFRAWVESRQKIARRIILAEARSGEGFEPEPPARTASRERIDPEPASRPTLAPRPPQSDPMWDDLLDGLGI